ncbi:MAG: phosphotransferase family protein [Acidimicrobiales bacterium]
MSERHEGTGRGDAPEGIHPAGVTGWFATNIAEVEPPLHFELIAGGRSNLTYLVTDSAGRRYVLRRPPTGHLLPTAHDMSREHRIIAALAPAGIPVAPALGLCTDDSVNGAPFYVMAFVDGHIVRTAEEAEAELDEQARGRAGESLVDTLAQIHRVDPDEVGLGDLGRKEGYIGRQLKRWYAQYQASRDDHGGPNVASVDEVHGLLSSRIPEQGPAGIVHGDYRLDNTVVDDKGRVVAVLDWELCTLGDTLADLGQLLVYWNQDGEASPLQQSATSAPGFVAREDLVARYREISGRDLSQLDFYVAFAYWKLACILEGVYTRYLGGAMGRTDFDFSFYPASIAALADAALEAAGRLG